VAAQAAANPAERRAACFAVPKPLEMRAFWRGVCGSPVHILVKARGCFGPGLTVVRGCLVFPSPLLKRNGQRERAKRPVAPQTPVDPGKGETVFDNRIVKR